MLKLLTRSTLTLTALLLLFGISSALGVRDLRNGTKHASHRRARHPGGATGGGSAVVSETVTASPVVLLGDEAVESNRDSLGGGQARAFPFHARVSGATGAAHVYVDSANTATTLLVGLYANRWHRPGSLLSTGSLSSPLPGAWNTVPLASAQLVPGTTYWLAVLGTGGTLRFRDHTHGPCASLASAQTDLETPATTWSTGGFDGTCPASAYVTAATPFPVEPPAPVELVPPPAPPGKSTPPPVETTPPPVETTPPPVETTPPPVKTTPPPVETTPPPVETTPPPVETTPPPVETTPPPVETTPPPPPPAAPANSALPTISGTVEEGQLLSATTGTWSANPTSYTYQWETCNTAGEACANIGAATNSTYKPTAGDVGHTLRVAVTATNAGGSTKSSSAATALVAADPPPPPPPPTASFTYSPASPETGQAVTFNGTSSTCSDGPCTYEWSDDGGTTRPIPALWPLGGGQTLSFTFSGVGTKYVRLVVTDAIGRSATVEHNVVVEEASPPPPVAPSNTGLPAVSGTPEVGKTLTASSGTWNGSAPIGYAYQWEDCNSSGESCSIISGATTSAYILASSDTGHTLRVVVKATNAGGAGEATSTATAPVTVTAKGVTPTDCFENPQTEGTERFETCGYPGPKNTGVLETTGKTECSALPEYTGPKTLSTEKSTIEGKEFKITLSQAYGEGGITVDAKEVTLNDDCFLVKGGGNEGPVIHLEGGASKFLLDNSTVRGENDTTQSYEHAINDFGGSRGEGATSGVVLKKDRFEDCGECLSGTFETVESYLLADESFSFSEKISDESLHRETWYANEETVVAKDDTFLVPEWEVAIIFDNTNNGNGGVPCGTHVTVENSLLAGSGQMFQTCGHSSNAGTGTLLLKNNRVARCLTMPMKWEPNETDGCSGSAFVGADSHGYFPYGGSQNIVPSGTPEPWTWEGNYWDDNLKTISKAEAEE